jgi:hypothetical protein
MSGAAVAEIFVKRIQPWLDEVPFGRRCGLWSVPKFELLQGNEIIFPKPRLMQRVPDKSKESIILEVVTLREPPVNVKLVVGKGAHVVGRDGYKPQPKTAPLYEFVELQTLLLRPDADKMLLGC